MDNNMDEHIKANQLNWNERIPFMFSLKAKKK